MTHEGKRGTYAIMVDGSVRFISENIPDEVFKSMASVAGARPKDYDGAVAKQTVNLVEGFEGKKLAAAFEKKGWKEFEFKEEGFTVRMPTQPTGQREFGMPVQVAHKGKTKGFVAGSRKLEPIEMERSEKQILTEIVAKLRGTKLIAERKVRLGSQAATEFELDHSGRSRSVIRMTKKGDRLFLSGAMGVGVNVADPEVQAFFESFKLLR